MAGEAKVEGHPEYVRRGGAIVNVDRQAFQEYVARRQKEVDRQSQVNDLQDEVADLKKMVSELLEKLK